MVRHVKMRALAANSSLARVTSGVASLAVLAAPVAIDLAGCGTTHADTPTAVAGFDAAARSSAPKGCTATVLATRATRARARLSRGRLQRTTSTRRVPDRALGRPARGGGRRRQAPPRSAAAGAAGNRHLTNLHHHARRAAVHRRRQRQRSRPSRHADGQRTARRSRAYVTSVWARQRLPHRGRGISRGPRALRSAGGDRSLGGSPSLAPGRCPS